ncbi:MAG TPA: Ku protein [Solirubrobacteraceae bacterium]|jgi:DNA end-binding protein Ku|nr:Ku protein [Solirubrobacteraceae bacterium]
MPRSLWSGSLSFGLVNVPVALVSAVRDVDVHFNQLDSESGARLHVERYCKEEGVAIPYEEVASGYPRSDGDGYVLLTDEELEAAQPEKTRTIDISEFVGLDEIDPIFFDHPYFLVPNADGEGPLRAYRLLVGVMEKTDRVAVGRFVLRTKERLVALRVRDGLLSLVTMHFADEIRPTDGLNLPGKKEQPSKAEVDHAVALVEELSCDWDPSRYEDRHRERLKRIIRDKRKGKTIKAPAAPEVPAAVPDLMAALRESLEAARGGDSGDGGGGGGSGSKAKGGGSKAKGGGSKAKGRARAKA